VTNGELGATGQKVYDFIRESHAATGLVPTVREIREAIGVSSIGTVGYWLDKLEALNLIRRDAGKNRSIQLRGESPSVPVPLVGEIRAGSPSARLLRASPSPCPTPGRGSTPATYPMCSTGS
jgi:SOS-response transcriptional repressor LexA